MGNKKNDRRFVMEDNCEKTTIMSKQRKEKKEKNRKKNKSFSKI